MIDETKIQKALHVICTAGYADDVVEVARKVGAGGATILNARGEGARHQVFMGITIDSEREIILFLTDDETCEKIMQAVKEKVGFNTEANCICFSIPVTDAIGISQH
ncbi:P-II family nitrogen regulator [Enterococcus sp. HY326]|uniref:P-II family nitrogen regulator n=1 Tax=Enterococcus sp. HY326 TaxID=2971265 RepID=UPI0022408E89|nr:hypothetical protein [Enterococcus sp. HY326]